jgi:hypothetical protein
MSKVGRNDPCPCGSGKKYKQCCLDAQRQQTGDPEQERSLGVPKAIDWLHSRHGKAATKTLEDDYFGSLEDDGYERLQELEEDLHQMVMINSMEWLLAEGEIQVRGDHLPVMEILLGPGGPHFTAIQRAWLEQLGMARLGLYEIIDLVPGESLCLKDLLFPELDPVWVRERQGSREMEQFDVVGARIMTADDHPQLSGALYPFPRHLCMDLIRDLKRELEDVEPDTQDARDVHGTLIPDHWLQILTESHNAPNLVDQTTGETLLIISDHYQVTDWPALEASLDGAPELEGNRDQGWTRLFEGEDALKRSNLTIEPGDEPDRITVGYILQSHADAGRPWFESLAGAVVSFIERETVDPRDVLAAGSRKTGTPPLAPPLTDSLSAEVLTEALDTHLRTYYANWADEPQNALAGLSPREAMETPEGLDQVKFLLRTYQRDEMKQARQQHRPPVSFDYLWEDLGLTPE